MRVLIAPDKFKGSLSAAHVADHIARGLAGAGIRSTCLPLADGGDGSVAAAVAAGMWPHDCTVYNAGGRLHDATVALDGRGTAVIEVANTCGLSTLNGEPPNPLRASSYGFGQAIGYALRSGATHLVLAMGGSASTDGGIGMLAALGYTFHDDRGQMVDPIAGNLGQIHEVRAERAVASAAFDITAASDVRSPLTGPGGAAAVFGPQKGVTVEDIDRLEAGLEQLVAAAERSFGPRAGTWADTEGAGAAGGCGFAALCLGGRIVSGAHYFLDLLDFDRHVDAADLVVTGEGRLDHQTLAGKLPAVVAERAAPTPVFAVVGRDDLHGCTPFAATYAVTDTAGTDTARDPQRTATCLTRIGADIGERLLRNGTDHTSRPNTDTH